MVYYNIISAGGLYEACLRPDAFLLWNRHDSAFIYPGDFGHAGIHHWLPDSGVSSVLLLTERRILSIDLEKIGSFQCFVNERRLPRRRDRQA